MKENGSMSTPPLRRRKDQEMLSPTVGTLATVPRATGDDSNAVEDLVIQPIHEDIARRAYQLYEERGCEHGRDQDDWFQAERELRQFLDDAVGKFLATEGLYVGA
jgi:hypothetical protein